MTRPFFISEVSSNHARDMDRCIEFIETSARIGCDAVKFQLFKLDELFAPEILAKSQEHRRRRQWELPVEFVPELRAACDENSIQFSCTPFYLKAVDELAPHVHFFKIASYELIWLDLIKACAKTGLPLVLSTGMANMNEIVEAVEAFKGAGGAQLTLLHCVSGYPAPVDNCNLSAIEAIRAETGVSVGWSDHSRRPAVIQRAIHKYDAKMIEFHLDLDEEGAEYQTGHCWLPDEIGPVISDAHMAYGADGDGIKEPVPAEAPDRAWRADPSDGLRPTLPMRVEWAAKQ